MIKGINRRIVEVNDTESKYFEKILFIVRTDCQSGDDSELKDEAKRIMQKYQMCRKKRGRNYLIYTILRFCASAAAGAGLVFLLFRL